MKGWLFFFQDGVHPKFHVFAAVGVVGAGLLLQISTAEWLWVIFAIGFVIVAEMFNSALEILCDTLHPDFHTNIGKVKDLAAGAVLLAALCAAIIGALILLPKLFLFI